MMSFNVSNLRKSIVQYHIQWNEIACNSIQIKSINHISFLTNLEVINNKLRPCNRSRLPHRLISWSNRLLINIIDLNLKQHFESSWQNQLKCVWIIKKVQNRSTLIEKRSKYIKNVKINWLFWYKLTISIFKLTISIFKLIFSIF